eukprot:TRINITY_DN3042_c0_g2_i1.p3 TRINITY_DN3042_c0_g2~~TRINITY_DN3042_c0_g2_i1.p3  ORF type:complete len:237 (+),score=70.60 TRINITY_DN3042_c0_g2_i1:144-854(+)
MPQTQSVVNAHGERVRVARRLYVGNLAYSVRWQELKDLFKGEGEVVFADVKMNSEGRSAGCGIVEFATAQEAASAMQNLHDAELEGRKIFVREDREDRDLGGKGGGKGSKGGKGGRGNRDDRDRDERPRRGGYERERDSGRGGRDSGRGGRDSGRGGRGGGVSVRVGNLDRSVSWQDLKDHFRQCGFVAHADIHKAGRSNEGIVEFEHPGDASRAIRELNDTRMNGVFIDVTRVRD